MYQQVMIFSHQTTMSLPVKTDMVKNSDMVYRVWDRENCVKALFDFKCYVF